MSCHKALIKRCGITRNREPSPMTRQSTPSSAGNAHSSSEGPKNLGILVGRVNRTIRTSVQGGEELQPLKYSTSGFVPGSGLSQITVRCEPRGPAALLRCLAPVTSPPMALLWAWRDRGRSQGDYSRKSEPGGFRDPDNRFGKHDRHYKPSPCA
jgi:hypothetical protein